MSSRSKVVFIILVVVIVVVLSSFLSETPATDDKLEEWEEEIVNPNNELDPLNQKVGNTVFIINVAQKVESLIDKFFSFVIGFVEGIVDKIFVFIYF